MYWTPFDIFSLIGRLASSKAARRAEQGQLVSTLKAMRASLVSAIADSPKAEIAAGIGQFSNAASDLFCQVKLMAGSSSNARGELESLATHVEGALSKLQSGSLSTEEADRLRRLLDNEIAKLATNG